MMPEPGLKNGEFDAAHGAERHHFDDIPSTLIIHTKNSMVVLL